MAVIDNLRMSQEALEEAISTFESKKTALENTYLKISNEVRELDGTWHGEASEKFKTQFEKLYQNLKQNETVMSNVISKLKQALNIYQEQEKVAQNLIDALQEGAAYIANL